VRLNIEYVRYYHDNRTHIGLNKKTPGARLVELRPDCSSEIRQSRESAVCITGIPGRWRRECDCGQCVVTDACASSLTLPGSELQVRAGERPRLAACRFQVLFGSQPAEWTFDEQL
jgi:hypothetical protein